MDDKAISLGQAYSQLGQVYAYLEREEAELYFVKSLSIFKKERAIITAHCPIYYTIILMQKNNVTMKHGRPNTLEEPLKFPIN